ncbi:hypothetical protein Bhyg_12315, partial [Pseudolycoriella hygida]
IDVPGYGVAVIRTSLTPSNCNANKCIQINDRPPIKHTKSSCISQVFMCLLFEQLAIQQMRFIPQINLVLSTDTNENRDVLASVENLQRNDTLQSNSINIDDLLEHSKTTSEADVDSPTQAVIDCRSIFDDPSNWPVKDPENKFGFFAI